MKVADLLESRRDNWRQLDLLCAQLEHRCKKTLGPTSMARFAALYRAACADLALAESYQLPPNTVRYLHQLVGRSHNQLYPSRKFNMQFWREELLTRVPQRLFSDGTFWLAFAIFWGTFLLSTLLASEWKLPGSSRPPVGGFADAIVGTDALEEIQIAFSKPMSGRDPNESAAMAGFYWLNNTGIGLKCFAAGLIFAVGGIYITAFNAAYLGAVFGYMLRVPEGNNFYEFVTAHGPFELTAIVLSAAAGFRLGFALVDTGGFSRIDSLRRAGRLAMPTVGAAIILFVLAGMIEAFISPSALPFVFKGAVAVITSGMLMFYFVMLGWPRGSENAA